MKGIIIMESTSNNITIRMDKKIKRDIDMQMQARKQFAEAIREMQKESVINGTDKMTMEEIDAIIAEVRKEKRGNK